MHAPDRCAVLPTIENGRRSVGSDSFALAKPFSELLLAGERCNEHLRCDADSYISCRMTIFIAHVGPFALGSDSASQNKTLTFGELDLKPQ